MEYESEMSDTSDTSDTSVRVRNRLTKSRFLICGGSNAVKPTTSGRNTVQYDFPNSVVNGDQSTSRRNTVRPNSINNEPRNQQPNNPPAERRNAVQQVQVPTNSEDNNVDMVSSTNI